MIQDLNDLPDQTALTADLCIVGTGAAGLALSREFLDTRLQVIVLESGGWDLEEKSQQLYESNITGLPFRGSLEGRFRTIGGATTRWGGQALPLAPTDFESRDWVAHSGWPIGLETLQPYYPKAQSFMLVDELGFDADVLKLLGVNAVDFDPALVHYHFSKWSPRPNLRETYAPALRQSQNVRLLFHANVTRFELSEEQNQLRELTVRSLDGRTARISARAFVLCAGAIETARLLLAGDPKRAGGVANANGLVGRFFQDHPTAGLAILHPLKPDRLQKLFHQFHRRGVKYFPRFSVSPEFQRRHRVLNMSAFISFEAPSGSSFLALRNGYNLLRRGKFGRELARDAWRCLSHPAAIVSPIYNLYVRRRSYVPSAAARLVIMSEQEPDADSRITLSADLDALGMPRSEIHWQPTPLVGESVAIFARALVEEFKRLGLAHIELDNWVEAGEWRSNMVDNFHHMGTTRMSSNPAHGVVDPDCRTHEVRNLFIGGSAVFPTGGHSNPTLTLIALCLRLADKLKSELL